MINIQCCQPWSSKVPFLVPWASRQLLRHNVIKKVYIWVPLSSGGAYISYGHCLNVGEPTQLIVSPLNNNHKSTYKSEWDSFSFFLVHFMYRACPSNCDVSQPVFLQDQVHCLTQPL